MSQPLSLCERKRLRSHIRHCSGGEGRAGREQEQQSRAGSGTGAVNAHQGLPQHQMGQKLLEITTPVCDQHPPRCSFIFFVTFLVSTFYLQSWRRISFVACWAAALLLYSPEGRELDVPELKLKKINKSRLWKQPLGGRMSLNKKMFVFHFFSETGWD